MSSAFPSQKLQTWFELQKRELPWRENPTPYAVWVSEVMLQQTQVSVVTPYFLRWMELFPSIQALADAPLDQVIKCWEGLGYYSRARNLHKGAKFLASEHQSVFPQDPSIWSQINGLGPYTIGAIRSFAFHHRAAAVDGNVMRVLTRYFNIADDISKTATQKKIWSLATDILPQENSWIHNEALIELGATVCTRKPSCHLCPIKENCRSFIGGQTQNLPYNSRKCSTTHLYRLVVILFYQNQVLLRECGPQEIMEGLHEFPYIEITASDLLQETLQTFIQKEKLQVSKNQKLNKVSHSFTRYRAHLFPFFLQVEAPSSLKEYKWVDKENLKSLAFSSGHKQIYHQLNEFVHE